MLFHSLYSYGNFSSPSKDQEKKNIEIQYKSFQLTQDFSDIWLDPLKMTKIMNCVAPGFIILPTLLKPLPLSCLPTYTPSVWSCVSLQSCFEWGLGKGGVHSCNQICRAVCTLTPQATLSHLSESCVGLPVFSLLILGLFPLLPELPYQEIKLIMSLSCLKITTSFSVQTC